MLPGKLDLVLCQKGFEILFRTLLTMKAGGIHNRFRDLFQDDNRSTIIVLGFCNPLSGQFVHTIPRSVISFKKLSPSAILRRMVFAERTNISTLNRKGGSA
jgi:hypothetical protein